MHSILYLRFLEQKHCKVNPVKADHLLGNKKYSNFILLMFQLPSHLAATGQLVT